MQFTININQKALLDIDESLDLKDATILDFVSKVRGNPNFETKIFNQKEYFWLAYSKIIEELPLLKIKNKESLSRRLKKFIELDLVEIHIDQVNGNKVYWRAGTNFYKIFYSEVSTQTSTPIDSKVDTLSTQKSNNQYTNNQSNSLSNPEQKINEFITNPMYGIWHKTNFPNLEEAEIKVNLGIYLTDYPDVKTTSINNYLRDINKKKARTYYKDKNEAPSRTAEAMKDKFKNAVVW